MFEFQRPFPTLAKLVGCLRHLTKYACDHDQRGFLALETLLMLHVHFVLIA